MVEKGSDHSSDKSPSTPEQVVQRTYSLQSARSGGKNSKVSRRTRARSIPDAGGQHAASRSLTQAVPSFFASRTDERRARPDGTVSLLPVQSLALNC